MGDGPGVRAVCSLKGGKQWVSSNDSGGMSRPHQDKAQPSRAKADITEEVDMLQA